MSAFKVRIKDDILLPIEFEILSYNHGVSMPLEVNEQDSTDTRRLVGPSKHGAVLQDMCITKHHDSFSPMLNLVCCKGQFLKTIELDLAYSSEQGYGYAEKNDESVNTSKVILTDCLITSVSVGGGGGSPIETITFCFNKIQWVYIDKNNDVTVSEWDLTTLLPIT